MTCRCWYNGQYNHIETWDSTWTCSKRLETWLRLSPSKTWTWLGPSKTRTRLGQVILTFISSGHHWSVMWFCGLTLLRPISAIRFVQSVHHSLLSLSIVPHRSGVDIWTCSERRGLFWKRLVFAITFKFSADSGGSRNWLMGGSEQNLCGPR